MSDIRDFVIKYIDLCNEYNCEVVINNYGVHCVNTDDGDSIPFAAVYPEWNDEVSEDKVIK